jgi:hypothetical protein
MRFWTSFPWKFINYHWAHFWSCPCSSRLWRLSDVILALTCLCDYLN